MKVLLGIFLILHALVHLLYAGQAARFFELRSGLTWPDGAWLFSRLFGNNITRSLAIILLVLTALSFFVGALGLFMGQQWYQAFGASATMISIVTYLAFWNGKFHDLSDQGGIGLLISMGILLALWMI